MPADRIAIEDNLKQLCNMFLQDLTGPLTIIDSEYRIFWANRRKAGEHGLTQEDIIEKVCYEILFGKKHPCSQCLVRKVKVTGRPCRAVKSCDLPEGRRVRCEQRAVPICDKNSQIAYTMVYGIIITDKILLQQRQDDHIKNLEKTLFEIEQHPKGIHSEIGYRQNHASLTCREIEVLHLMAKGQTNPEISQELSISAHTAKSHVVNIFNKPGGNNRTQAAVMGTFHQLVHPPE
jgi:DNA-binding CsgD family transcriptional regulator